MADEYYWPRHCLRKAISFRCFRLRFQLTDLDGPTIVSESGQKIQRKVLYISGTGAESRLRVISKCHDSGFWKEQRYEISRPHLLVICRPRFICVASEAM